MRLHLLAAGLTVAAVGAAAAPAAADGTFRTPSKNIACAVETFGVRCDIQKRDWSPPPKPRSCRFDWGSGLNLGNRGRARINCTSDTLLGQGRILNYGSSMTAGRFTCRSRTSGVRCVNTKNGHGFTMSRQAYTRF